MLREITLKEAVILMDKGNLVYGVNLNQEEPKLFKLPDLLKETRILADVPENYGKQKKIKSDYTDEEIEEIAKSIDGGKIGALKKAGWTLVQIADEFRYTVKDMERIIKVLEQ